MIYDLRFTIGLLLVALIAPSASAQPVPPTTAYTRYLMTSTNQAQFQERAGIDTNGVGTTYNLGSSTNLGYGGLADAARSSVTNAATGAALNATNKLDTDLRAHVLNTTNGLSQRIIDSTNNLPVNMTNAALGVLAYPGMAQHVKGRDFFNLWEAVSSNRQARIAIIGDSVVYNGETVRGVRKTFENYMSRGGWGSIYAENPAGTPGGHLKFYMDNLTEQNTDYSPSIFYGLANGTTTTSVFDETAPATDRLSVYFRANTTFGTILVETNSGAGWGTRATINAAWGSHAYTATNFALSPKLTYSVRLTSTGTNVLENVALTDSSDTTNSFVIGRLARPGALLASIVTNAGFNVWLTNYNPQVLLFEVKDPLPELLFAANYIRTTFTNRDIAFIANTPNLPDDGAAAARQGLIDFCRTNDVMLFDKYALLTPTNYWYNALPLDQNNIWQDGAHLGAMGIRYASGAFADWFDCTPERFAMFGLYPLTSGSQTNDLTKANLAGGNTFTGFQSMQGLTVGAGNNTFNTTGTLAGVNFQRRDSSTEFGRLYASGSALYLVQSSWATDKGIIITNASGKLSLYADPAFFWTTDTPRLGTPEVPWWLIATNADLRGTTRVSSLIATNLYSNGAGLTNLQATNIVGTANRVMGFDASGFGTNLPTTGSGVVVLSNAPNIYIGNLYVGAGGTINSGGSGELAINNGIGDLRIGGPRGIWTFSDNSVSMGASDRRWIWVYANNIQASNAVTYLQSSLFPTSSIPVGSTTVTNLAQVPWRGYLVTVATNHSVGGWMWQTNGPSGVPVWGAFNPASQP